MVRVFKIKLPLHVSLVCRHGMGRGLVHAYPVFAEVIARADTVLKRVGCPWSLSGKSFTICQPIVLPKLMSTDELFKGKGYSRVDQPDVSQAACTALQLGLVDLLSSFGLRPACVVGHSSGEIAAAYAAGVVAFDDCILLAYYRGQAVLSLKEKVPEVQGSMLAVGMGFVDMSRRLKEFALPGVNIACVNSPASVTISGDEASIATISKSCVDG